ncbi:ATP-binding protein [Sphingomonas koreensis]
MILKFHRQHRSIKNLLEIELPSFSVVYGQNGSGKSHFLEAISLGSIRADILQYNHEGRPLLLSKINSNFRAEDGEYDNGMGITQHPELRQIPMGVGLPSDQYLVKISKEIEIITGSIVSPDPVSIQRNILNLKAQEKDIKSIYNIIDEFNNESKKFPGNDHKNNIAERFDIEPIFLTEWHLHRAGSGSFGNPFSLNIASAFGSYRDAILENRLQKLADIEDGTNIALNDDKFRETMGHPPWDTINTLFDDAEFGYRFDKPTIKFEKLRPILRKNNGGEQLILSDLSDGERSILSFLFAAISPDKRKPMSFPKLLLMDEVDASMHPQNIARLIRVIESALVEQHQVSCILVTHSPVTVAMATKAGIFRMAGEGIQVSDRATAVRELTLGIPTVSLNPSGSMVVFVESESDAFIHSNILSLIKTRINLSHEIVFTSPGLKTSQGQSFGTGCDIVINTVKTLRNNGNFQVGGLLDWDTHRTTEGGISVLAAGTHYAIENILLDPLLIGLLLMRCSPKNIAASGVELSIRELLNDPAACQKLADFVHLTIHGEASSDKTHVEYLGGFTISHSKNHLLMRGHDLADLIREKIPPLKAYPKDELLMMAVVNEIFREYWEFTPFSIATSYMQLSASIDSDL